jgi:hypothetical protein
VSIFCLNLSGFFSDSLQSAVGLKSVSWVLSCRFFPFLLALEEKKEFIFKFLILEHKKKIKSFSFLVWLSS